MIDACTRASSNFACMDSDPQAVHICVHCMNMELVDFESFGFPDVKFS